MTLLEIVMKLNGAINSVAESHTDKKRFKNLEELCCLTDKLFGMIWEESEKANYPEFSRARSGKYAKEFLISMREQLADLESEE